MTQEEVLNKIDNKSAKIVDMCIEENKKKVKTLLKDIRNLANTVPELPPQPVAPVHFCINEDEVVDEYDMGSCAVTKTKTGFEWRAKGGYRIYVENNNESLSGALQSFFDMRDSNETISQEELENQLAISQALTYVLNIPMVAFSDTELMLNLATMVIKWMTDLYNKSMNDSLKEDDNPELTKEMEQATLEFEELKEQIPDSPEESEL